MKLYDRIISKLFNSKHSETIAEILLGISYISLMIIGFLVYIGIKGV